MIFTTHNNNIPQIRTLVNVFGGCYVHGDGNLYTDDADGLRASDNQKNFSNPKREENTYRVHLKRGDVLPKTKEELDRLLLNSKNQEILTQRHVKETSQVKNFAVQYDDDVNYPEAEIDYQSFNRSTEQNESKPKRQYNKKSN